MMLPQCSHITRKRGVYYYRRRLPKPAVGEIAVSLRTKCFREAEWLSQHLDRAFERVLPRMADTNISRADVGAIARQYLRDCLATDLRERRKVPDTNWRKWALTVHFAEEELQKAKSELAGAQANNWRDDMIDWIMKEKNVPEEQRQELTYAILRANVLQWETIRRRALGEQEAFADPEVLDGRQTQVSVPSPVTASKGPLLSVALPGFLQLMEQNENWRGQTLLQGKATYRMFIECCGDRPVTDYLRTDLAKFYDTLRGLPQLYSKDSRWRDLPVTEIVEEAKGEEVPRLSMTTVKRHFSALGRLFAYLKSRGDITGENPAYGFEFPKKGRARDKRSPWSSEMLTKLFASPVWTGCLSESRRSRRGKLIIKDEKYWLPLLGVYHGNRLEEFAQLVRSDVREEEDIWFLDINDEGQKQVKNEQSKRRVPIHPELLRLGFIEYVENAAPSPDDHVFPLLRPGGPDNKLGYYFSKWWTQYRKDIGVYIKGVDYHSFRATVATKLAEAEVSLEVRNELLGHEGKSIDEQNYQKGFPLKFLADAIAKVSWPEVQPKASEANGNAI